MNRKKLISELRKYGEENTVPNISDTNAKLLVDLIKIQKTKTMLEIWTANWFSAINFADELEKNDLIRIDSPSPNERITSPLTITGEARGYWFFEGDFPVVLIGSQGGNILVESYATTESDWMTEEFVPFSATIEFDDTDNDFGMLILEKDNPSELPENADSLIVPIKF